jgi:NADH:ubiquinone oxidoreductase subunit D
LPKGSTMMHNSKVSSDSSWKFQNNLRTGVNMESLIQHFKIYSTGFPISSSYIYLGIEAPKGEFGVFFICR